MDITREQLIDFAIKSGFDLGPNPARKLKYMVQAKVLPAPRRVGRGRGMGCDVLFPTAAMERLADIDRLRRRGVPIADMRQQLPRELTIQDVTFGAGSSFPLLHALVNASAYRVTLEELEKAKSAIASCAKRSQNPQIDSEPVTGAVLRLLQAALGRLCLDAILPASVVRCLSQTLDQEMEAAYAQLRRVAGFVTTESPVKPKCSTKSKERRRARR